MIATVIRFLFGAPRSLSQNWLPTSLALMPPPSLPLDKKFYASRAWQVIRYQALLKANGRCQCCGRAANDGVILHVDHIRPRSRYPAFAVAGFNLQVLCEDCNMGKGAWDMTDWRR